MRVLLFSILMIGAISLTYTSFAFAQTTGGATNNPAGGTGTSNTGSSANTNPDSTAFEGLANVYRLGLSLVGISALLMIIWGGLDYVMAGDNSSKAGAGRKKITAAIAGIILAAASYLILYTINPDLVKLRIGTIDQYIQQSKP